MLHYDLSSRNDVQLHETINYINTGIGKFEFQPIEHEPLSTDFIVFIEIFW